jgi:hypothetical protein
MGDLQVNVDGVLSGLRAFAAENGLGKSAQDRYPWDRIQVGTIEGSATGKVTKNAWWTLPSTAGAAARVETGKAYWLALDPEYTTPNVVVAVHFGNPSQSIWLRPGDSIPLPQSTDEVFVWNPVLRTQYASYNDLTSLTVLQGLWGYVGFIVGRVPGGAPHWDQLRPRNMPGLLASYQAPFPTYAPAVGLVPGVVSGSTMGTIWVPTQGLRGVRVTVFPRDTTGSHFVTRPADLAGVLRFWNASRAQVSGAPPVDTETVELVTSYGQVMPMGDLDCAVSANACAFEREVVCGGAITVTIDSLTGTNVDPTSIVTYVSIEGY